jgi:hypothetical protein
MELQWECAVDLLSEAFGRSEGHDDRQLWWVRDRAGRGTPCAIVVCRDKQGVRAWAGSESGPGQARQVRDVVELLDIVQSARRLAEPR